MTREEANAKAREITGGCSCPEVYAGRGLVSPNCVFHDVHEDIAAALITAHNEALEAAELPVLTKNEDEIILEWRNPSGGGVVVVFSPDGTALWAISDGKPENGTGYAMNHADFDPVKGWPPELAAAIRSRKIT